MATVAVSVGVIIPVGVAFCPGVKHPIMIGLKSPGGCVISNGIGVPSGTARIAKGLPYTPTQYPFGGGIGFGVKHPILIGLKPPGEDVASKGKGVPDRIDEFLPYAHRQYSIEAGVGVAVFVGLGVFVDLGVLVLVGVNVFVSVGVAVFVLVGVEVFVSVGVAVFVCLCVGTCV
jgi:hypothetical protein